MRQFGIEELGDRNSFKLICCKCGREAKISPTHHYKDVDSYTDCTLEKITLEFRCFCGNEFVTTIHKG